MVDRINSNKRSRLMSRVRNKNTDIELLLRKHLWSLGYRYRLHYKIFGKPDIVFLGKKVAIFCDGNFWHGKNFNSEKGSYKSFWREKITDNINRDKKVNEKLNDLKWKVLRFWEDDIEKRTDKCLGEILDTLEH